MPSIEFYNWRETPQVYWRPAAKTLIIEVDWTVRNDLNTAIQLLPRFTGFGIDTGYLLGHVVNPGETYSGSFGQEIPLSPGRADYVTIEYAYVYAPYTKDKPIYPLGSITRYVVHPSLETPEEIAEAWAEKEAVPAVPSPTTAAWIVVPEAETPEEAAEKYYEAIAKPVMEEAIEKLEEKLEEKIEEKPPAAPLLGLAVLALVLWVVSRKWPGSRS